MRHRESIPKGLWSNAGKEGRNCVLILAVEGCNVDNGKDSGGCGRVWTVEGCGIDASKVSGGCSVMQAPEGCGNRALLSLLSRSISKRAFCVA